MTGPTPLRLAAFDIAGTTIDEGGTVYRVLARVVAEHGTPAPDADIRHWMGADKREALGALTGHPEATEGLHTRFVQLLQEEYAAHPPQPVPGVPETIAALRAAGVRIALTTGFDRQITDPLLAAVGWRVGEQLDAVVCAPEVAAGRPQPHMIHRAMQLTGITDPATVLVAGDTALDVRAGHAAGAGWIVGVLSGAQTREELQAERPTHVLDSLQDLPDVLAARTA